MAGCGAGLKGLLQRVLALRDFLMDVTITPTEITFSVRPPQDV